MAYTVKKIAKLSGVSVRTLHWYDKIDLLKPAYVGDNGYRYYEDEQLFTLLYDILFFKDLGLTLSEIKQLISQTSEKQTAALKNRKNALIVDIQLKSSLLVSVEKALTHFENMSLLDGDYPHDFDTIRQREYEFFLITYKNYSAADISKIKQHRLQNLSKPESNHLKKSSNSFYNFIKQMLEHNISHNNPKVQNAILKHFLTLEKFYNIDLNSYCKIEKFYSKRPLMMEMHNYYHNKLSNYLSKAIDEFKASNLELIK